MKCVQGLGFKTFLEQKHCIEWVLICTCGQKKQMKQGVLRYPGSLNASIEKNDLFSDVYSAFL